MIVYPAIDIRGGRCVRLVEGDFDRETAFDADPGRRGPPLGSRRSRMAPRRRPRRRGRRGASQHRGHQPHPQGGRVPIQLGGGLRTEDHLAAAFDLGINRVVLGTAAIRTPELVPAAVAAGRTPSPSVSTPATAARRRRLARTDRRRGDRRRRATSAPGVQALHLHRHPPRWHPPGAEPRSPRRYSRPPHGRTGVSPPAASAHSITCSPSPQTGVAGVIIGRALYDGRVDLPEALRALRAFEPAQIGTSS